MQTVSINVMNLCVPCENRCRYCLLSYDGRVAGTDFDRSAAYARRFYDWLGKNRPEMSFLFGWGYSMEHPKLWDAIDFCRSIGSPTGEFLQFDGMKFRNGPELEDLLRKVQAHGVRLIDLTFYGTEEYHDRFAARRGDFRLMMDTLAKANMIGLDVTVSIPVTRENVEQIDDLIGQLEQYQTTSIRCFIPHGEGRGRNLEPIRFSAADMERLGEKGRSRLNTARFRTESSWLQEGNFPAEERRVLTLVLTRENMAHFENQDFAQTIRYLEGLDDAYFEKVPSLLALAQLYGDPAGDKYYSLRDLYLTYQRRYIADNSLDIYDINDERQSFSRRF